MKYFQLNVLFWSCMLFLWVYALSNQLFSVPPIGNLLNPFGGIIANEEPKKTGWQKNIELTKSTVHEQVRVFFDERNVPHIYAENQKDLYFAQGYVTASQRLWQMDFLTYVASGRLSELLPGESFLSFDRMQRRMGIAESAKSSLKLIEKDAATMEALNAYTKGVNSYIGRLKYKNFPFEYKVMNYRPEPWSNLKSVMVMKYMASSMTGYDEDLFLSKMILALGEGPFNELFPDLLPKNTPIQASLGKRSREFFVRTDVPAYLNFAFLSAESKVPLEAFNPRLGSNCWAVGKDKSLSGFPMLAADPHLNLTLPAVWMEMQLSCKDLNVYGVSIPGTPFIIIGFNEHIAWSITNAARDVKDWYKVLIDDEHKNYKFEQNWLPLASRVEEIKRKGQSPFLDTVFSTQHGPLVFDKKFSDPRQENAYLALKWQLQTPSNELATFMKLNRSTNYRAYRDALKGFSSPALNFVFISKSDTIAADHHGLFPVKFKGQGKFVLDGTRADHLYNKYIPEDSLPRTVNPAGRFIVSANQRPTDGGYDYYYNGYFSENRAYYIAELLRKPGKLGTKDFMRMQLDNTNSLAREMVPHLIKAIKQTALNVAERSYLQGFGRWEGQFDSSDPYASFFEEFWENIRKQTWDEIRRYPFFKSYPDDLVLASLIKTSADSPYFDNMYTPERETPSDLVTACFIATLRNGKQDYLRKTLRWDETHKVNFAHLGRIPGLGVMDVASPGHPEAINAVSSGWGPSWRMIVEMGDRVKAVGIYPGGQSGNPGSVDYSSSINDWAKGKYYDLHFFYTVQEAEDRCRYNWIFLK